MSYLSNIFSNFHNFFLSSSPPHLSKSSLFGLYGMKIGFVGGALRSISDKSPPFTPSCGFFDVTAEKKDLGHDNVPSCMVDFFFPFFFILFFFIVTSHLLIPRRAQDPYKLYNPLPPSNRKVLEGFPCFEP